MAKIIVVDDTPFALELIGELLSIMGHEAVPFSCAKDALADLDDNPQVDLLITDYKMPGMDGYALIQALREMDSWKNLPVIVLTGGCEAQECDKLMACPPINLLEKPVSPPLLSQTIQDLLNCPPQMG